MRESRELKEMGDMLMSCKKEELSCLDQIEFQVRDKKVEKLEKIKEGIASDKKVTMIQGVPVMINHVSDDTAEDVMTNYIESYARFTY